MKTKKGEMESIITQGYIAQHRTPCIISQVLDGMGHPRHETFVLRQGSIDRSQMYNISISSHFAFGTNKHNKLNQKEGKTNEYVQKSQKISSQLEMILSC